jgi:ParB-like chromosome segregation protein Spo0J
MPNEPAAVYVAVDELTPWADNPRVNAGAVEHVAESIKRFGFASPIIARQNGEVIAGHTRLLAAKQLGLDVVPVRYLDLDPVDAKLLALADNRVGEIADWNTEQLKAILQDLRATEVDVSGIGFTDDELAELIGEGLDYSLLDADGLDSELDSMAGGVRRAIQIDFDTGDYDEANAIILTLRRDSTYIGGIVLDALRANK